MSQENTPPLPSQAEDVFEELAKELHRLKSAVSHLSLSEQAAAKAIDAAEQVLQGQAQLSQQLTDYVSRLSHPGEQAVPQLQQLIEAAERQQGVLDRLSERLTDPATSALEEDKIAPSLQRLLTQQEQLTARVSEVQQQLKQGVAHYPSQQLADFLLQLVEPLALPRELQPTVTRSQQILQEVSIQVKTLASSTNQQQAGIAKGLQVLTDGLKSRDDRRAQSATGQQPLGQQADGVQALLQKISQRLDAQPAQPTPGIADPVDTLSQQLRELTQLLAGQQVTLRRQKLLGFLTLLATLTLLALHFAKT